MTLAAAGHAHSPSLPSSKIPADMLPTSLALLRPLPTFSPHPPLTLVGAPPRLRVRCLPSERASGPLDDSVLGMMEELLGREENRPLLDGLDQASLRVDRARSALADIERQEAEARRAKEYARQLEDRLSEISESQQELLEARAMVDEAQRELSLNMDRSSSGEPLTEDMIKDTERWESVKAALVASTVGTLASLPISLYETSSSAQLLLHSIIISISCALFGVTFRYTIRRDLDNAQLKTGSPAAFGFVRGLAELSADRPLEPDISSLISLSIDGAAYVVVNVFIFLSAAIALDFCFKTRLLSPYPLREK